MDPLQAQAPRVAVGGRYSSATIKKVCMTSPCHSARSTAYPSCVLQGIFFAFNVHFKVRTGPCYRVLPRDGSVRTTKTSRVIARAMARGLGFVTPCPEKQGKNAYFSNVSDASGTASDVANVSKDCKHFWPPLWVVLVEE